MIHKQLPCYPLICCFLLLLGCTQNQEIQPPQSQQNIERAVRPVAQVIAPDQRQALVIGNSEYTHAGVLRNPVNDAQAISDTLRQLDFEVMTLTNASQREMEQSIRDFGKNLQGRNGVGLFFYAGHGMQIDGENYLLPIDIDPVTEEDVRYDAVPLGRLLGQMRSSGNQMNLIVLDACRNNPFARSFRSSSKGLAQVIAPTGSFISYATAPGQVAADGEGDNGLFTAKLLDHMKTPGLKLEDVFKQVRVDVQQESNNRQVPWDSSSLIGDFYFVSPKTEKKIIVSEDKPREQTTANSDTSSINNQAASFDVSAKKRLLETKECISCDLFKVNLEQANLDRAVLRGANLGGADLRGASLYGVDLERAVLSEANLSEANLNKANLDHAKFDGAVLRGADLRETDLGTANLRGTDLRDAILGSGGDVNKANFWEADLRGAVLDGVRNLARARFCNTTMPDGSISNRDCAFPVDD